jgi:hypothetical protein
MIGPASPRTALKLELELGSGRHAASARLELLDWLEGPAHRVARVTLRGWIGGSARRRIERAFFNLAARDVDHVVLDCRAVQHLAGRVAGRLIDAALMLETRTGGVEVCGLPGRLSRRLATSRVRCWPAAAPTPALGPTVEYAS